MSVPKSIRRWLAGHAQLKQAIIPPWNVVMGAAWYLRRVLTSQRPIRMVVANRHILIWPEGQIARAVWTYNFEAIERSFLENYLRPGMTFLNVGANIGIYALLAAEMVGPMGKVFAFEPSKESYKRLINNIELNGYACVVAENLAVADCSKVVAVFDVGEPLLDAHRYVRAMEDAPPTKPREVVQATSLDRYFANSNEEIDVLLVDAEGAERDILLGAKTLLHQDMTLVLECTDNVIEVKTLLENYGYRFWRWDIEQKALKSASFEESARIGNVIVRRTPWRAR